MTHAAYSAAYTLCLWLLGGAMATQALAQKPLFSEKTYAKIAKHTCACLEERQADLANSSPGKAAMAFGGCALAGAQKEGHDIQPLLEERGDASSKGEQFGAEMAVHMLNTCPTLFMTLVDRMSGQNMEKVVEREINDVFDEPKDYDVVVGEITAVEQGPLTMLDVQAADGSTHRLVWLTPFEGDDALKANPTRLVGATVEATTHTQDLYQADQKRYVRYRVLSALRSIQD